MSRVLLAAPLLALLALVLGACGTQDIQVSQDKPGLHAGAMIFQQRCGGCHTLNAAGTHGSAANIRTRERNDGPNFNARCESQPRVLYAIRNGGFSGAIMPQNIVVGHEAVQVARFVSQYAGSQVKNPPSPTQEQAVDRTQSRGVTPQKNQPITANNGAQKGGCSTPTKP